MHSSSDVQEAVSGTVYVPLCKFEVVITLFIILMSNPEQNFLNGTQHYNWLEVVWFDKSRLGDGPQAVHCTIPDI